MAAAAGAEGKALLKPVLHQSWRMIYLDISSKPEREETTEDCVTEIAADRREKESVCSPIHISIMHKHRGAIAQRVDCLE